MNKKNISDYIKNASIAIPVGPRPWKNRALASIVGGVLLVAGIAGGADAANRNTDSQPSQPFVELGVLDSQQGETRTDFILRVSQAMAQRAQNREVCGMLMTTPQDNAWRVRLISTDAHIGCALLRFNEKGFVSTGETIHTHDVSKRISLSKAQSLVKTELTYGPGYVVTKDNVFHVQHELAPVELVGQYSSRGGYQPLSTGGYTGRPQIQQPVQDSLLEKIRARRAQEDQAQNKRNPLTHR